MANCCFYTLTAVSPDRDDLERFVDIMTYQDPEWYLYGVRDFYAGEIKECDGLYTLTMNGDVAWSTYNWLHDADPKGDAPWITTLVDLSMRYPISFFCMADGEGFDSFFHVHDGRIIDEGSLDKYDSPVYGESYESDLKIVKNVLKNYNIPENEAKDLLDEIHELWDIYGENMCLSLKIGGYDWLDTSAQDIYSDKHIVPKNGGVWYED